MSTALESGFKKLRIRMPDTPDTCGRKPYPEKKVADSKIGCLSNNAGDGYENVS